MEGGNMTRDQFLCEEVLKECWHEHGLGNYFPTCIKCKKYIELFYRFPNFNDWPDKGRLLDFCMGQERWGDFEWWARGIWMQSGQRLTLVQYLLDNFADLVAEYRGWKEEGK